jgi:hypothetical protein
MNRLSSIKAVTTDEKLHQRSIQNRLIEFCKDGKIDAYNPLIITSSTLYVLFSQIDGDNLELIILKNKLNSVLNQINLEGILEKYLNSISENVQDDVLACLEIIFGIKINIV